MTLNWMCNLSLKTQRAGVAWG